MKLVILALLVAAVTAEEYRAIVVLRNDKVVHGNITFKQVDDGPVVVSGTVLGLSTGLHGFHIHEKGDISGGCASTLGHFNPNKVAHGAPSDNVRHVGDLGNILANERGVANIAITDDVITLCSGPHSIIGRAVVIHSGEDDLGRGGEVDSLTTGHAGSRVTCGVIGIQSSVIRSCQKSGSSSAVGNIIISPLAALSVLLLRL